LIGKGWQLSAKSVAKRLAAGPLSLARWLGRNTSAHSAAPSSLRSKSKIECAICGNNLAPLPRTTPNCPKCCSRPRARALVGFVHQHIRPLHEHGGKSPLPLLAFALTAMERKVLTGHFAAFKPVTLFGEQRDGLEVGVDARDLSRYPDASFAGSFGILVFDYFEEHEQALTEAARVLADGGIFFHQLNAARLVEGDAPPSITSFIKRQAGALNYIPDEVSIASVKVGIDWFTAAMERAGFTACHINIPDAHTGESNHWFLGIRERRAQIVRKDVVRRINSCLLDTSQPRKPMKETKSPVSMQTVLWSECSTESVHACPDKTFSVPVSLPGADRILFTISVPPIPESLKYCEFAEHVLGPESGEPTDKVIIVGKGRIGVSDNLGQSWIRIEPQGFEGTDFINSFTTQSGRHIIQARGWLGLNDTAEPELRHGQLFVFSPEWELLAIVKAGDAHWHGSASISERNGTMMFAEYHDNLAKYDPKFKTSDLINRVRPCAVWRSRDEGLSWEKVLEQDVSNIRHFHTVTADPFEKHVWWLSSGDRPGECHVWRSGDDGDTWVECSDPDPNIVLPPAYQCKKEVAHRHTDVVVTQQHLIWGADDLLGSEQEYDQAVPLRQRAGSRIYRSLKTMPLAIEEVAYIGHPIRSMIDVGPGWIVTAEGKSPSSGHRPSIHFVDKSFRQVIKICDTDNYRNRASGLTYSKASRKSKDGRFFSFKEHYDLFDNSPRIAQYAISFVKDL
jgi:Methyltransferase domain